VFDRGCEPTSTTLPSMNPVAECTNSLWGVPALDLVLFFYSQSFVFSVSFSSADFARQPLSKPSVARLPRLTLPVSHNPLAPLPTPSLTPRPNRCCTLASLKEWYLTLCSPDHARPMILNKSGGGRRDWSPGRECQRPRGGSLITNSQR